MKLTHEEMCEAWKNVKHIRLYRIHPDGNSELKLHIFRNKDDARWSHPGRSAKLFVTWFQEMEDRYGGEV
jgi:hypothetical protein